MTSTHAPHQNSQHDLAQVIEPLASYICAADRPTQTLRSVVAKLLEEVKSTNAAAVRYFSVTSPHLLHMAV